MAHDKPIDGFETPEQCDSRRAEILQILRRPGSDAGSIVRKLELEDHGWPCGHPACPTCMRGWRYSFIRNAARLVRDEEKNAEGQIGLLVWVLPKTAVPKGELRRVSLRKLKGTFAKHLVRAGLSNVQLIGAIDLSLNENSDGSGEPVWQPQLQAVGLFPASREAARQALRARVKATKDVPRPVKIEEIREEKGGLKGALGYCYKSFFQRRISYVTGEGKRRTRKLPLRPASLLESILFLDRKPRHSRIFTFGVKRKGLWFEKRPKAASPRHSSAVVKSKGQNRL